MKTRKNLIAIILIGASAMALAGALVSQYVFGLHPCPLCIYQRYPYALLIVVGALYTYTQWRGLLWLAIVALLVEIAIALYHTGIEYRWWEGFSSCAASGSNITSIEALRAQIMATPAVRCDEPAFVLLLSMAGWNVVYASTMLACLVYWEFIHDTKS